jgi:hypothetical protein
MIRAILLSTKTRNIALKYLDKFVSNIDSAIIKLLQKNALV